jgi:hypothetical protein
VFQVAPAGAAATTAQNALATVFQVGDVNVPRSFTLKSSTTDFMFTTGVNGASPNGQLTITAGGQGAGYITSAGIFAGGGKSLGFAGSVGDVNTAPDVYLYRDAANTLALRNGAAAQRFNVYNTWTSATNYEAFKIDWITTANTVLVGTEKGSGGGTARALAFQTDGTTRMQMAASVAGVEVNNHVYAPNGASLYIGANGYTFGGQVRVQNTSGVTIPSDLNYQWSSDTTSYGSPDVLLRREAAGVLGVRGTSTTVGAALGFIEQTAPAAPATNGVRIYAEDNGSGKTRLMALFATGSAVQIAVEP